MPRYSDLPQCYCGDAAIHPDDADYVVQGIPCCSRECYNIARQGSLNFEEKPRPIQLSLRGLGYNSGSILDDYDDHGLFR